MAAAASRAVHRELHACWAALRSKGLASLARCWANILMKVAASSLQRPPNSIANTTRRALPPCVNSGYVLALLLRAIRRAAPAVAPLDRRTWEAVRGDTRVVSTASCAKWQSIRDHLNSAFVSSVRSRVEVSHEDVCAHCCTGFPAYSCHCFFQGHPSRAKGTGMGASGSVVRKLVMWAMAPAPCCCVRQWQTETPEKQHREMSWFEEQLRGCGQECECSRGMGATL